MPKAPEAKQNPAPASEPEAVNVPLCPRDGSRLLLHVHGQAELHACAQCHGLWISRTHLRKWFDSNAADRPRELRLSSASAGVSQRDRAFCPSCGTEPLRARKVDQVEIDICPACQGLWLDATEFEAIVKWHQRKHRSRVKLEHSQPSGTGAFFDTATIGIDLVDVGDLTEVVTDVLSAVPDLVSDAAGAVLEFVGTISDIF